MIIDRQADAGNKADSLIATEVAIQDRMWGDANERADSTHNQLIDAARAQLALTRMRLYGESSAYAVACASGLYPPDWNGFRDYGSNVANLVVVAAYIRSEIKRRILFGEDTTRTKRGEAYAGPDVPYISAEDARAQLG